MALPIKLRTSLFAHLEQYYTQGHKIEKHSDKGKWPD